MARYDKRDPDLEHFNRVHALSGQERDRQRKELSKRVPVTKALPHKANDQAMNYN